MAKIEVEIDDSGRVGTLPEALQKHFDSKFNEAFGKGAEKAATEAKGQIATFEKQIGELKAGSLGAAEREKLQSLITDKSKLEEALATANKDFAKAQEIRDKRHADELLERDSKLSAAQLELKKRTDRIQELAAKDISVAALNAGARKESLAELSVLLGGRIGLDDGLQPFVKDATDPGKVALDKDGKTPLSIEGFVTQYLADHPHHKAAPVGRGGGAAGGQSVAGRSSQAIPGANATLTSALNSLDREPTRENVRSVFAALNAQAGT